MPVGLPAAWLIIAFEVYRRTTAIINVIAANAFSSQVASTVRHGHIGSRALSFSDHYCQSTCHNAILHVILSVRSFFNMHLLRQFLSESDEILTPCSSVWRVYMYCIWSSRIVDPGLMASLQRANLITYRLVVSGQLSEASRFSRKKVSWYGYKIWYRPPTPTIKNGL